MKHDGGWRKRGQRYLYRSQWFDLRQDEITLPTGEAITYTLVEHPGYAMVVPVWPDGRVVLERVYRWTVQETVLECPSGGLDGDAPEQAAQRELLEETGLRAGSVEPLGHYHGSNGISNEHFHLFLARDLEDTGSVQREPTEQMEVETFPIERAVAMALSGEVRDGPSALALLLAGRRLGVLGTAPAVGSVA